MPYGDRTGPVGAGPMTGRRMGYCAGFDRPGNMNPGRGFGFGMGRGGGFGGYGHGWRNRYWATGIPGWNRGFRYYEPASYPMPYMADIPREEELKVLETESRLLKKRLSDLEKRIAELDGSTGE
ncbi:MAG TPA: hypothetical protein ENL08_05920 [Bacteroidetes bacterium]|nr:hypothetical protein [Bacteroidota bacterium]